MKNYIAFLEDCIAGSEKDIKLFREAKELLQIYDLPEEESGVEPVPVNIRLNIREASELIHCLNQQVGRCPEWRLLIYCASNLDPLCTELNNLQTVLCEMMYYEPDHQWGTPPNPVQHGLTCTLPQQIWIITLRDLSEFYEPAWNDTVADFRRDESKYKVYPPNCRFIRYGIDYRLESDFSSAILKLHWGIRCLARTLLPCNILKSGRIYSMSTNLNEAQYRVTMQSYERWLDKISNHLMSMETLENEKYMIEQDIYHSKLSQYGRTYPIKGKTIQEIKQCAEKQLEADHDAERQKFVYEQRAIMNSLPDFEGYPLSETGQKVAVLKRNETELSAFKMQRKKLSKWMSFLIRLRHLSILGFTKYKMVWNNQINSHYEMDHNQKMQQEMQKHPWARRLYTWIVFGLCNISALFASFALAQDDTGAAIGFWQVIFNAAIQLLVVTLVYKVVSCFYNHRCTCLFRHFKASEKVRISRSRAYIKDVANYLRLQRILTYSEQQKEQKSRQKEKVLKWRKTWKHYHEICERSLQICGREGTEQLSGTEKSGNIKMLLEEEQVVDLYGLPVQPYTISVSNNKLTVPFSFIQGITLKN